MGGGGQLGGYDALDYSKNKQGDAGQLGNYAILAMLPEKSARFLFEFHAGRFESLDLPLLPADRSHFDVQEALKMIRQHKQLCHVHIIIAKYDFSHYSYYVNCVLYINYDIFN